MFFSGFGCWEGEGRRRKGERVRVFLVVGWGGVVVVVRAWVVNGRSLSMNRQDAPN